MACLLEHRGKIIFCDGEEGKGHEVIKLKWEYFLSTRAVRGGTGRWNRGRMEEKKASVRREYERERKVIMREKYDRED